MSSMSYLKAKVVLRLKNITVIRKISKPFIERKRSNELKKYSASEDAKKLLELKNKFINQRCFIIGNGPSLSISDLELLSNEYTFGANGLYKLFSKTKWRPTFYCSIDSVAFKLYGSEIAQIDCKYKFIDISGKKYFASRYCKGETYFIRHNYPFKVHRWDDEQPFVSEDITQGLSLGYTVTFTAMQLAIYMGFKEIYLIGVDHNYSKKVDKYGNITENKNIASYCKDIGDNGLGIQYTDITTAAYIAARDYSKLHDINIRNATRGGCLEVFERVQLENIL